MISTSKLSLHLKTFFLTRIEAPADQPELGGYLKAADFCFSPLHSIYEKVTKEKVLAFAVDPRRRVMARPLLNPQITSSSLKALRVVLKILGCIPGVIYGTIIKINLLCFVKFYRMQHTAVVDEFWIKKHQVISLGNSTFYNIPLNEGVKWESRFNIQDLGRIAIVCKAGTELADALWLVKRRHFRALGPITQNSVTAQEVKSAVKQEVAKIETALRPSNKDPLFPPFILDHLLEMPIFSCLVPSPGEIPRSYFAQDIPLPIPLFTASDSSTWRYHIEILKQTLGDNVMARTEDYKCFAVQCERISSEGIRQSGIITFNRSSDEIYWWPLSPSQNYYRIEMNNDFHGFLRKKPTEMQARDGDNPERITFSLPESLGARTP